MNAEPHKLHIYFLPTMAPGHMIPMIDIARRFAKHGVKATIVTTSLNAIHFSKTIERDAKNGSEISLILVNFPFQEAGLPEGCENLSAVTTVDMTLSFIKALDLLQEPVEHLVRQGQPDCIVAGAFFTWATEVSAKFKIPRVNFYGTGFFPMCIYHSLKDHKPHKNVESDSEEFIVPGLPNAITMSRRQLSDNIKEENHPMAEFTLKVLKSELTSYGTIVNSFYELEPDYANHYRGVLGRKAWHIGPVSLFNESNEDKIHRGKEVSFTDKECLNWLNSKKPNSVVYICFGSMAIFSTAQLIEIAKGLEASGQNFIWVVKEKAKDHEVSGIDWLPEGFERRLDGKGLIIKGWAPQVLILDHEAVGGFITHCGWNSLLEGVAAGVPMVTWPLSAEQFFNEKLVTEILKIGIPVGAQEWTSRTSDRDSIKGENIEKAVVQLMVGEEAERMRSQARKLVEMARRAVDKGGSSANDLNSLLQELRVYHP